MSWRDFIGKTIASIDDSAVNCVHITFTDGTKVDVYAECGSSNFSIPFFDIQVKE